MLLSRLKFRPTFWPTVTAVPMLIVLIGLSVWQVQRLHWKEALIAERESRISATPIELPATGDPAALEYRRVTVTGHFLNDKELYLAGRQMNEDVGYHIVTPFVLESGGAILVDRGWVPVEKKLPDSRPDGQISGTVTLDGVVRLSQIKAWMQPTNEPEHNVWFFMDLPAMVQKAAVPARTDLFVEAGKAPVPGGFPVGGQTYIYLPNDHLQYAITWGLLAVALVVIYIAFHVQRERERK